MEIIKFIIVDLLACLNDLHRPVSTLSINISPSCPTPPVTEELVEWVSLFDFFVLRAVNVPENPVWAFGVVVEFGGGDVRHMVEVHLN